MSYGIYKDLPTELHFEPTSDCNARCPQCPRTMGQSPFTDPRVHITEWEPSEIDKVLNDSFFKQITSILVNGNYGDIVKHSSAKELLQIFLNRNLSVFIKTNGGALNKEFWTWLGTQKNVVVEFGIDGLADTHHLYRRNTRFDVVIKNAKTFIEAGGNAQWVMTVFKHNEHQIEDCRTLSSKIGFNKFKVRHSMRWREEDFIVVDKNFNFEYRLEPSSKVEKTLRKSARNKDFYLDILNNKKETSVEDLVPEKENMPFNKIDCYVQKYSSVYLSADKKLWPCCWIGLYFAESFKMKKSCSSFVDKFLLEKKYDLDFNNILKYSAESILAKDIFKEIEQSWDTNTPFKECVRTCDKKSNWTIQHQKLTETKENK